MRYAPIDRQLFVKNRRKFTERMKPKSLAVFHSNDTYPISADSTLPFQQHRDLFYLSGIDQEESILVLFPDARSEKHREMLFLRQTDANLSVWEGQKLSRTRATELSGIQTVYGLEDFEKLLHNLMPEVDHLYLNRNEHYRASAPTQTREDRFIQWAEREYPLHHRARSNPILQHIRSIKEREEIQLIQQACDITEKGFRRALRFIQPGAWEYEIEAEYAHEFLCNRAEFAYSPIIGSGQNATVLHYFKNDQACRAGDLVLMDVGSAYAHYASDMTRCVPVSGRFTKRQKAVYNAVLRVKKAAVQMLVPGTDWKAYHREVGQLMTAELIGLRLLDQADVKNEDPDWPAYKKYFMHGTSHHLGLDTHDYGLLWEPMEAHMVFTVEPGIYIPEENLGIRLEDDYVIQVHGEPRNLMQNIPIEADEIEDLMNAKSEREKPLIASR